MSTLHVGNSNRTAILVRTESDGIVVDSRGLREFWVQVPALPYADCEFIEIDGKKYVYLKTYHAWGKLGSADA